MAYHINLAAITIDTYRTKLETTSLPPSRKILRERLDERFSHFKSMGISNVNELLNLLKKKGKMEELAKIDCFSGNYLTILLRELNSTLPRPNKISDFQGIPDEAVKRLEAIGITNTIKLYPAITTPKARAGLSKTTGVPDEQILKLASLTDLSRIRWVGSTFATMLYDLGINSVEIAAKANPELLHTQLNELNIKKNYFRGHIGLNDIRVFVEFAGDVPVEVEF